jgi:hypothetical protein
MTSQPPSPTRPASGGTGLLLIISAATVVTVALEAGFIAIASWALLPLMLLVILLITGGVIRAVGRIIDDGAVASPRMPARPDREEAIDAGARPLTSRPALGQ